MKKYLLWVLFFAAAAGVWRWNVWVKGWMTQHSLSQIQEIQKSVVFQWESMTVHGSSLKVHFKNVRIQPLNETTAFQQSITPQNLTVQIAPWASLMNQSLRVNITVSNFKYQTYLSQDSNQSLFELFEFLPLNKVILKSTHLTVTGPRQNISAPNTYIHLQKQKDALSMKIKSNPSLKKSSFFLKSHLSLQKNQINIIALQINNDTSQLSLSGRITGKEKNKESFFDVQSEFSANDLNVWLEVWRDPLPVQGFFNIKSQLKYSDQNGFNGPFEFFSKPLTWTPFHFSQIKIKGKFENRSVQLDMAHFEKEKGFTSYFENTQIHLGKNKKFRFKNYSSIEDFRSVELFFGWNSFVRFQGHLKADCAGDWSQPQLKCSMQMPMQEISMKPESSPNNPPIFELKKAQINSDFMWTPGQSDLKGTLVLGSSLDSSIAFEGSLNKDRAKILFNGPINFDHIQSIYGFNLQGSASQWEGQMVLSRNGVFIDSYLDSKNLYFSKYLFGNVRTDLQLTPQGLYLNKIKAKLRKSQYTGFVHVLFEEGKVQSQAQWTPLFLEDLSLSVKDAAPAPLYFIGKGKASLSMDSPFRRLNYNVNSQFQNVKIYDEFFRKLTFNISSKKGWVQITKARAEKTKNSSLQAAGSLTPSNSLNVKVTGSNVPVEKSETLNRWLKLPGILDFQLNLKGLLTDPVGALSGAIRSPDQKKTAQFTAQLTPSQIKGEGNFFENSLLIRKFKFSPRRRRISFSATAKDWNFIQLTRTESSALASSRLTGSASLHFSKDLKKPSGFVDIKDVNIQYGFNQSSHSGPIYAELNNGRFSFQNTPLEWKTNDQKMILTKINEDYSQISGVMGMEIFNLIFPEIKNIGGNLKANLKIRNDLNNFSPEGDIQIENGRIDINSYINPFQSIRMKGVLKSQVMQIKHLKALTPLGGSVTASGLIDFSEPQLLPLDMSVQLNDKAAVYISDKIHGTGYGSIKIYGDRAPYTLSGVFNVRTGAFKQELDSAENQKEMTLLEGGSASVFPFYWDLRLQFDNPFPVENTLFSSLLTGSVHLNGNFLNPSVSGQINFVPGGKFHIRDYDFEITSGRLSYNSQSIYEPQLQIIGVSQFEESTYEGEREFRNQYNITADITGTPSDFQFKLSSQPALSESDILSMMALGARSIGDSSGFSPGQIAQSQAARYSYAQIGAVLFQDIFGRGLNKSLGLRLSFSPYMNISKNQPSNKIGIHKRWFEKMNTSYIGSLERDYDSFKVEYMLSPAFSLLGIWEKKETLYQDQSNTLGVELEYKLDF